MQNTSSQWEDYEVEYKPLYQHLFHYLEHSFEPRTTPKTSILRTIDHITTFGLESLEKVLNI
jgi:hypothetical protein